MSDLINIVIAGIEIEVPGAMTLIQACELAGKEIPRFCYHKKLSVAANCRSPCWAEWESAFPPWEREVDPESQPLELAA